MLILMRVCYLGDITSQSGGLKASPALWRIWPYTMKVPVLALWCVGMWNSEGSEAIHLPLCLSQCFNHEGHWIHDFWMLWWRLACRCENKRQGKLHRRGGGQKERFFNFKSLWNAWEGRGQCILISGEMKHPESDKRRGTPEKRG